MLACKYVISFKILLNKLNTFTIFSSFDIYDIGTVHYFGPACLKINKTNLFGMSFLHTVVITQRIASRGLKNLYLKN